MIRRGFRDPSLPASERGGGSPDFRPHVNIRGRIAAFHASDYHVLTRIMPFEKILIYLAARVIEGKSSQIREAVNRRMKQITGGLS